MTGLDAFIAAFDRMPVGSYGATFEFKRYRVSKSVMATGRSQKLVAEELGGNDFISFNLYRLASGETLLKPCEMSEDKVIDFVMRVDVD
ncbi:MAG: hypothetical protein AAF718_12450 [Pseudomonadota bacterium]